jgi:tetratricopeptide (TPR) repeat protein
VTDLAAGTARPGEFHDVENQFERALKRDPDNVQIVTELARLRILQQRWAEAEMLLRQVVARDSHPVGALNDLAWILARHQGNASESLRLVEQAISLAGPDSTLLDTRAIAQMALERTDAAITDLKRALDMSERPVVLFHLAQAYAKTHRPRDAREALERARSLGLEPDRLDAAERLVYDQLEREAR